ncbi:MAG: hypothetical protein MUP24_06390 [Gillisia sp.]|nr:hypothetical protein [Gillisia sp.]
MKLKLIFIIFSLFSLLSCNQDNKQTPEDFYIGGQIANPSSKYVIISKNDVNLDTLYLNDKNQFGGTLKNIKAGLYVFKHPPENQIIYIEPGDSTLVWLNTLAFDESINFSGKGSEKSNFLTNLYLLNQQDNNFILNYYKLDPSEFAQKTDSIRNERQQRLLYLDKKYDLSEDFKKLANSSIDYEFYDLRERYAFLIRKYYREFVKKIPKDFHQYREEISFNDENLQEYYVYLNLIDDYLRTKSLEYCDENNIQTQNCLNLNSNENIKRRMVFANTLIQNKNIKNIFLDRLAAQGIIYAQNTENIQSILDLLTKINYSGERLADLKQMALIQKELLPGYNIGGLKMRTTSKDTVLLKDISRNPIITYYWSVNSQEHHKWQHKIIEDLREKYPEIDFIGINIDKNQFEPWVNVIKNNSYDPKFEFQLVNISVEKKLLKNYLNKLIFVEPSGTIARGDAQLNTPDIETKILEFISY